MLICPLYSGSQEAEAYKGGERKGNVFTSPYQQSFRIDDLLTRRDIEQQPDHFPKLPSPTIRNENREGGRANKVGGFLFA